MHLSEPVSATWLKVVHLSLTSPSALLKAGRTDMHSIGGVNASADSLSDEAFKSDTLALRWIQTHIMEV